MFRYGLAAALTVSGIAFAHSQDLLDRAGLLGSCTTLAAAAPNDGQWLACRPGTLTGYPDLRQDSCAPGALRGETRFWLCPTRLVGSRLPDEAATS
jgi:hypothetical protein